MPLNQPLIVDDADVYILTFKGNNELQASETSLAALPLRLLVLIDGKSTVAGIRQRVKPTVGNAQFLQAMRELVRDGYADLNSNQLTQSLDFIEFFSEKPKQIPESALDQAQSGAASGITTLQQHGYYVRIAMRPANQPAPDAASQAEIIRLLEALRHAAGN